MILKVLSIAEDIPTDIMSLSAEDRQLMSKYVDNVDEFMNEGQNGQYTLFNNNGGSGGQPAGGNGGQQGGMASLGGAGSAQGGGLNYY